MTQQIEQACQKCKKSNNLLVWCNKCNKFYCSPCFKEYELLREANQHSHSFAELIGQQK